MADYDAIVVGAGHNGLAAASVLAKNGFQVLILEKTNWPGGMAATKELFKGYKHSVGAPGVSQRDVEAARAGEVRRRAARPANPLLCLRLTR